MAVFRQKCSQEFNIPAEKVEGFKKWQFEDDQPTRDYIRCVFGEFPIFADGHILVDNLVQQLKAGSDKSVEELTAEVNKCVDERKADEDESAYCFRQFNCFKSSHLQLIRASVKKD